MSGEYQGELRCVLTHGPSGVTVNTDAPVDNHGRGESFSPTDLTATSLGACMATIMGIKARDLGVNLTGMTFQVTKTMASDTPRRICALTVNFTIPNPCPEADRIRLERAAATCPVAHSLHPDIVVETHFDWA